MDDLYLYEAAIWLGISHNDLIKHIKNGDIQVLRKTYTATTRPPKASDKISLSDLRAFEYNCSYNRIHQPVRWKTNAHGCNICISSHPHDSQGCPVLTINGKHKPIAQYLYEMTHQGTGGLYSNISVQHKCGNVNCISLECLSIQVGNRRSQKKPSQAICKSQNNDNLQIGLFTGRRITRPGTISIARIRAIKTEKDSGKSASEVALKYKTTVKVVSRIWKDDSQSSKGLS